MELAGSGRVHRRIAPHGNGKNPENQAAGNLQGLYVRIGISKNAELALAAAETDIGQLMIAQRPRPYPHGRGFAAKIDEPRQAERLPSPRLVIKILISFCHVSCSFNSFWRQMPVKMVVIVTARHEGP